MNLLTHFKLTAEQLEPAYQDNKEQILSDWPTFKKDYFDGKKTLQCDSRGEITLNLFPLANSKQVVSPYEGRVALVKPTQQETQNPKPEKRKLYINTILQIIKLEVEQPKLDKLIQVIDLVNEDQGEVALDAILKLQD